MSLGSRRLHSVKRQASDTDALTNSWRAFHLSPRNRADVGNVPADTGKCLYDGNDHYYQEHEMNQRGDDCPEKYQDAANTGNRPEHRMHNSRHNVKEKPCATEDDRLHRVKAHETVVLLEDIKNDAADQRDAGDGCSHIGR